jgi:hypothetical protein
MIVKKLHEMGMRSELAYDAAMASVGLSFLSWLISKKMESAGTDRADRWGIFVGQWAPTFFGLGLALKHLEDEGGDRRPGVLGGETGTGEPEYVPGSPV